jgi:predicted dienelactone hydrolase
VQCCRSGTGGACSSFAEQQWNCADPQCSETVPEGTPQPSYQCAEFVSRTLAASGHINLDPLAPQSQYGSYTWSGTTYDLLWVSSQQGGPLGLEDFLNAMGWQNAGTDPGAVNDCSALMVNGAEGPYSHTCVGVGPNVVDAHNNARHQKPASYYHINAIWNPPGSSLSRVHNATAAASMRALRKYRETPRRHVHMPPEIPAGAVLPNPTPSN